MQQWRLEDRNANVPDPKLARELADRAKNWSANGREWYLAVRDQLIALAEKIEKDRG